MLNRYLISISITFFDDTIFALAEDDARAVSCAPAIDGLPRYGAMSDIGSANCPTIKDLKQRQNPSHPSVA